jgi:hypothetical protein
MEVIFMNLKSAIFNMRDAIMDQQVGELKEEFIRDLELKNELKPGTLVFYFNHLTLQKKRSEQVNTAHDSKKVNRKWTKFEIEFMLQYIKERQEEGALNITEILEEVAQLLNRGYQSVNYKYYNLVKVKEKKKQQNQNGYQFTTIAEDEVPVLSTEMIHDYAPTAVTGQLNSSANVDLLDILSGLITNVQQLPGIQLNELLRSLYQLTNMALQNQDVVQQLEAVKAETFHEKEAMQEKLKKKEQQLIDEKRRNDELQEEVTKLAKEIIAFNQLGDAAKIQNLKSYNQRLNHILDGYDPVLKIAVNDN